MPGHLTQGDVAAGWIGLGLFNLIPIVTQGLDTIRALLGIEEALPKDRPRRCDPLLDLELRHHTHAPASGYQLVANTPPRL